VRLSTVKNGKRYELASQDVEMSAGVWHEFRFEARGEQLRFDDLCVEPLQ
jgi:hypothetical protein